MGKILVIAEKPSVGHDIAKVIGCKENKKTHMESNNIEGVKNDCTQNLQSIYL